MTGEGSRVAFVPLAGNQTAFYVGVAQALRARGVECSFLSFHEPSLPTVGRAGFDGASVFAHGRSSESEPLERALATISRFGVADVDLVISHERAAYELRDRDALIRKFASHLLAVDDLLTTMVRGGSRVHVVQELGGFLSVAAVYYAARRLDIQPYVHRAVVLSGTCLPDAELLQRASAPRACARRDC